MNISPKLIVLTGACILSSTGLAQSNLSIGSNFNGTAISGDDTVWFNANFQVNEPKTGLEIYLRNSSIVLNSGKANETRLNLPDTNVFFTSGSTASLTYDEASSLWNLILPESYSGSMFLSGFGFDVPDGGLAGGTSPVVWSGDLSANRAISGSWKWGAAVYTEFADYDDLGIVAAKTDQWSGQGQVGTPVNIDDFVIGGARGGGGSNYTGSWSGTQSFKAVPEPGTLALLGAAGLAAFLRKRKSQAPAV